MARLQVEIDGNAKGLTTSLGQANSSLDNFSRETAKVSSQTQGFTKSVGNANGVAMEFNRIIQDAPFGMMGIGNNLQQLTANFQTYSQSARQAAAQTGQTITTMTLLKGAMSSIFSPLNLLTLGVAAVTSAWTLYERSQNKANKEMQEAEEKTVILGNSYSVLTGTLKEDSGFKKAIASVNDLKINVDLARDGVIKKDDVVKQYNKTIGDSAGKLKTFADVEDFIVKKSDAYIQAMLLRAAANTALEEAAKAAVEAQKLAVNPPKVETQLVGDNSRANEFITTQGEVIAKAGTFVRKKLTEDAKKTEKTFTDIAGEFQRKAAVLSQQYGFNLFGGASSGTSGGRGNTKDFVSDVLGNTGDYYADEIYKITSAYQDLINRIQKSKASQNDISKALGIAEAQKDIDLLKVSFEKLFDNINGVKGASKGITVTAKDINVIPSVSSNVPSISPLINSAAGRKASRLPVFSDKDDEKLQQRISKLVEGGFRRGISGILDNIDDLGSNFYEVFNNVFSQLSGSINKIFTDVLSTQLGDKLKDSFTGDDFKLTDKIKGDTAKAIVAGAGIAGGLISSMSSKSSAVGQGFGGALSGAAAGMAFGPWGAAIGGVVGAISGIFGAKAARKQEKLQEEALKEQRKQTALMEYQNAKGWESNIIGQMTSQGIVNGFSRDATGQLTAKISGQDLLFVIERAGGKR